MAQLPCVTSVLLRLVCRCNLCPGSSPLAFSTNIHFGRLERSDGERWLSADIPRGLGASTNLQPKLFPIYTLNILVYRLFPSRATAALNSSLQPGYIAAKS